MESINRDAIERMEAEQQEEDQKRKEQEDEEASKFFVPEITFSEVIGMKREKRYLMKFLKLLTTSGGLFDKFRMKGTQNCLLYGPPGTGKTLLATASAGELGLLFADIKVSDVSQKWVGSGAKNFREIFDEARENEPCVLFIDELDALGKGREKENDTSSEYSNTLTELMKQMEMLHREGRKVFIIAASNNPWDIDSALKRSGRLDYVIYVRPPRLSDRINLLKFYLGNNLARTQMYARGIGFVRLGFATMGMSPADIEKLCTSAKLIAIERCHRGKIDPSRSFVEMRDIREAITDKEHARSSLEEWYLSVRSAYIGKPKLEKIGKGKNAVYQSKGGGKMSDEEKKIYKDMVADVSTYLKRQKAISVVRWIFRSPVVLQ